MSVLFFRDCYRTCQEIGSTGREPELEQDGDEEAHNNAEDDVADSDCGNKDNISEVVCQYDKITRNKLRDVYFHQNALIGHLDQ